MTLTAALRMFVDEIYDELLVRIRCHPGEQCSRPSATIHFHVICISKRTIRTLHETGSLHSISLPEGESRCFPSSRLGRCEKGVPSYRTQCALSNGGRSAREGIGTRVETIRFATISIANSRPVSDINHGHLAALLNSQSML